MLITGAVHVIDFYFDEAHAAEKAKIIQLVQKDDPKSMQLLSGYVREAMRASPPYSRQCSADTSCTTRT